MNEAAQIVMLYNDIICSFDDEDHEESFMEFVMRRFELPVMATRFEQLGINSTRKKEKQQKNTARSGLILLFCCKFLMLSAGQTSFNRGMNII